MVYNIKIRLTTAFLGSRKTNDEGEREIARILNSTSPMLFTKRLRNLCCKYAIEELRMSGLPKQAIKIEGAVHVSPEVETKIQVRNFYSKAAGMEVNERFEAYPPGTEMSFGVYVKEGSLTQEQLTMLFRLIGKYDGISQFGINWGYGKFDIVEVIADASCCAELTNSIEDQLDECGVACR